MATNNHNHPIRGPAVVHSSRVYCEPCAGTMFTRTPLTWDPRCCNCGGWLNFYLSKQMLAMVAYREMEPMLDGLPGGSSGYKITPYRMRVLLSQPRECSKYFEFLLPIFKERFFKDLTDIPPRLPSINP